ncbi:hypothetical protein NL108_016144 [Boleophthalmus pectinirostris]|nr:hypothetical protein NL108_016144 [Boleophthalmus pectinirostris]
MRKERESKYQNDMRFSDGGDVFPVSLLSAKIKSFYKTGRCEPEEGPSRCFESLESESSPESNTGKSKSSLESLGHKSKSSPSRVWSHWVISPSRVWSHWVISSSQVQVESGVTGS